MSPAAHRTERDNQLWWSSQRKRFQSWSGEEKKKKKRAVSAWTRRLFCFVLFLWDRFKESLNQSISGMTSHVMSRLIGNTGRRVWSDLPLIYSRFIFFPPSSAALLSAGCAPEEVEPRPESDVAAFRGSSPVSPLNSSPQTSSRLRHAATKKPASAHWSYTEFKYLCNRNEIQSPLELQKKKKKDVTDFFFFCVHAIKTA